jgi:putative lipoprotein (rSAM/lipoprotein system)
MSALLALGGCEANKALEEDEYHGTGCGIPYAHYSVKGIVTDENGNPIKDLEVRFFGVETYEEQSYVCPNTIKPVNTDEQGTYFIETNERIYKIIQVNVNDIDGAANGGEFASDSLRNSTFALLKDKDHKKPWLIGNADISMPDIKLKKRPAE